MSLQSLTQRYPTRATRWQLPTRSLAFDRQPLLMGIVNVTSDSFSDGGRFLGPAAAVRHGVQLVEDGADILDIGGESTRPYATRVDTEEELRRVIPVVRELSSHVDVPISIDTSKYEVAVDAIEAGAEIINDVTGFRDVRMVSLAVESKAGVCAMHMQGTPQTMQDDPVYENVVEEILSYLAQRKSMLLGAGVAEPKICLDPGIGFGKTHQHNLTLLANCERLHSLRSPILVGHSRKGFIGKVLGDNEVCRTAATVGIAMSLAHRGIQVIRVHDVLDVKQALALFDAVGGIDGQELDLMRQIRK